MSRSDILKPGDLPAEELIRLHDELVGDPASSAYHEAWRRWHDWVAQLAGSGDAAQQARAARVADYIDTTFKAPERSSTTKAAGIAGGAGVGVAAGYEIGRVASSTPSEVTGSSPPRPEKLSRPQRVERFARHARRARRAAERSRRRVGALSRKLWLIGAAVVVVTAAAVGVGVGVGVGNGGGGSPQTSAPSAGAVAPFDYLAAKAAELRESPTAIIAFVRDDVATDDYQGELRGPVGTLWAMSGDQLDRCLLLQGLLAKAGRASRLVHGVAWGVEVSTGHGHYRYVGPNAASDPGARPFRAVPADQVDTLAVTVRTTMPGGRVLDEPAGTFSTGQLSGNDVHAFYERRGSETVLVVSGPGSTLTTGADAAQAVSQDLVFSLSGPGQTVTPVTRELFTRAFPDYLSMLNAGNRYDITVTTGWVPDSVRRHEVAAAAALLSSTDSTTTGSPPVEDALEHTIAYTFLAQSDANIEAAAARLRIRAHVVTPRITIVADEVDPESGGRDVSIDLRSDVLAAEGPPADTVKLNTINSLYDSSLEGTVLQSIVGGSVMSASASLAAALNNQPSSLGERLSTSAQSLDRLLSAPLVDGASLSISPKGDARYTVTFTRRGETLAAAVSPAMRAELAGSSDPEIRWMLSSPAVTGSDLSRAVLDTEVVLADSAQVPIDYQAVYRFDPTPRWYTDFTADVTPGDPSLDTSVTLGPAGVTVHTPGYPTGNKPLPANAKPKPDAIFVSSSDLDNATSYQEWWQSGTDSSHGYTIEMLSRKVFAELDAHGWAIVRYRYTNGSLSEPLKLYALGRIEPPFDVDGVTRKLTFLDLGGGPATEHLSKPKSLQAVKPLYDPTDRDAGPINELQVVDDSEYPFLIGIVGGPELFQADVPGTVLDASTGEGVAGATITLAGPAVSATSWPGGAFDLPAFSQPFATTQVRVHAPGYQTLTTKVDLANRNSVPLRLALKPIPIGATWVDRADLASVLPRLHLSDRSRSLIRQAITADPAVSVLVPAQPVVDALGPVDAWLQVNGRTGEMFPMLEDGLYGASTLRDLTGALGGAIKGAAGKGAGWATGKARDWVNEQIDKPFDASHALVGAPISFFAGHVAGWYLFAAGALTALSVNMDHPSLTLCQFHQITVSTAVALVKGGWVRTAVGFGLKQALKKAGYPGFPFLNGRLYNKAMQYGALSAISALAGLTKHDWGLSGTTC